VVKQFGGRGTAGGAYSAPQTKFIAGGDCALATPTLLPLSVLRASNFGLWGLATRAVPLSIVATPLLCGEPKTTCSKFHQVRCTTMEAYRLGAIELKSYSTVLQYLYIV